ncbi:MAG: biopolymer transporter ExbD [Litoreibacter sp.]|nr:biopolymer transporter ExbD [Litoreibacter sp.]MCY4335852.1 biopolymer transporter ExbD [Litoreibacter sp.]
MRSAAPRRKPEQTIALINIVFLMLIFFMVAGTLSPPIDPELKLVDTRDLEGRAPDYALILDESGQLQYRGAPVAGTEAYLADLLDLTTARIMPDRAAPAARLLEVARALRSAGVERVLIVTEKAQP